MMTKNVICRGQGRICVEVWRDAAVAVAEGEDVVVAVSMK